jgi:hypothetical protein
MPLKIYDAWDLNHVLKLVGVIESESALLTAGIEIFLCIALVYTFNRSNNDNCKKAHKNCKKI